MFARLIPALVFAGLGVVACLYAAATAPRAPAAGPGSLMFAWTASETACLAGPETCDGTALIAHAASAPLSHRPFAARLAERLSSPGAEGSDELAAMVLARDPRSAFARLVLGEAALKADDREAFLSLVLPLFDLDPARRAAYADVLAALSPDDAFRAAVTRRLAPESSWGAAYLSALTTRGGLPAGALMPFLRFVPSAQAPFLSRLTRQGSWDVAYVAFAEFLAAATGAEPLALTIPFNPDLRGHPAPAPFNWSLPSRTAQLQETGGVYVFYEGRKAEVLLVQTFPLGPGTYTLETGLSGETTEAGGGFRWQISCAAGGAPFAQLDVGILKAAPGRQDFAFEVPQSTCAFVTLSLRGVPGAFPRPARIEVRSVHISARPGGEGAP